MQFVKESLDKLELRDADMLLVVDRSKGQFVFAKEEARCVCVTRGAENWRLDQRPKLYCLISPIVRRNFPK